MSDKPIIIIGGGVIGLGVGWQLARRGRPVTVLERDRAGRGASWVSGGMIAPHAEVGFEEELFLGLGRESVRHYPRFLDELAEDSGRRMPLDDRGTLFVAFDRDHTEAIRRLFDWREHLGLPARWMSGGEARDIEPLLSPKTVAAMLLPDASSTMTNHSPAVGELTSMPSKTPLFVELASKINVVGVAPRRT